MWKRRFVVFGHLIVLLILTNGLANRQYAFAQENAKPEVDAKAKSTAERFLQVVLRRPTPGTALDRVYEYYLQTNSLPQLVKKLQSEAGEFVEQGGETGRAQAGARYLLIGLFQRRGRDYESAVESLSQAESLRESDAMASFYLAEAYVANADNENAIDALKRSIKRKPAKTQSLRIYSKLGRLYQRMGQRKEAVAVYRDLESAFPGDSRVGEEIAKALVEGGQLKEALKQYEKLASKSVASQRDSDAINYQIAVAELKQKLGRDQESLADFESIVGRLRPSSWFYKDVRRRIESYFLRTGDVSALAEYYREKVKERPDDVDLYARLGRAYRKAGRTKLAQEALEKTLKLAPNSIDVRLALVDVLRNSGQATAAAAHLETLTEQDGNNPDYLIQLGHIWLEEKAIDRAAREKRALAAWQRLAELRNDDPVGTAQVADLMRSIKKTDSALKLYQKAIDLSPDQPQFREYLGEYYHQLGRKEEALKTWAEIASGERENRDNLVRLAEVLNSFQFASEALNSFEKADQYDLMFAQRLRFAELLTSAKRYDKSRQQLVKAESIATTEDERGQLLSKRIELYLESGTIDEEIASLERTSKETNSAKDYRELTLVLIAADRVDEAIDSIEAALESEPNSVQMLSTAAHVFQEAQQLTRAIDFYQKLARIDERYKAGYLRKISTLQMTLGDADGALDSAEQYITAMSGNSEAYQFYAEQCLSAGRSDDAISKLRVAIRLSPRDEELREQLATLLANNFKTDEAIELYWSNLISVDSIDERAAVIPALARLYERRGNLDALIDRLNAMADSPSTLRMSQLLIARAHETVYDFGAAQTALGSLLDENPNDLDLLDRAMRIAINAYDFVEAAEYKKRILQISSTPEDEKEYLSILLYSGRIEEAEELVDRIQMKADPRKSIEMVDALVAAEEHQLAIKLCERILEQSPDLWEVRARLILSLHHELRINEAKEHGYKLIALRLPVDTPADFSASRRGRFGKRQSGAIGSSRQASSSPAITSLPKPLDDIRIMQTLRAFNVAVGSSLSSRTTVSVNDFHQARLIAILACLYDPRAAPTVQEYADICWQLTSIKPTKGAGDHTELEQIWLTYDVGRMSTMLSLFSTTYRTSLGGRPVNPSVQKNILAPDAIWRVAELDERNQVAIVDSILKRRSKKTPGLLGLSINDKGLLTDGQFDLVKRAMNRAEDRGDLATFSSIAKSYHRELIKSGRREEANAIFQSFSNSISNADEACKALQFVDGSNDVAQLTRILGVVYDSLPEWAEEMSRLESRRLLMTIRKNINASKTLDFRLKALRLTLAIRAIQDVKSDVGRKPAFQSTTIKVSVPTSKNSRRTTSKSFTVPLERSLLPSTTVQNVIRSFSFGVTSSEPTRLIDSLREEELLHRQEPFLTRERKLRGVLGVFAKDWLSKHSEAFVDMSRLAESYPDDHAIALVYAEMTRSRGKYPEALDVLNGIESPNYLVRKKLEELALEVAAKANHKKRELAATKFLLGVRLDPKMERKLADHLTRLGKDVIANSILQRIRGRRGQSADDRLELAESFLRADQSDSAGEVATSLFNELITHTDSKSAAIQQRVIEILHLTNRMEAQVARIEKRAASAPNAIATQTALANVYLATSRVDNAAEIYSRLITVHRKGANQAIKAAHREYSARRYNNAVAIYLKVLEHSPESFDTRHAGYLSRAVSSSKMSQKLRDVLAKTDQSKLSSNVSRYLLRTPSLTPLGSPFGSRTRVPIRVTYNSKMTIDQIASLFAAQRAVWSIEITDIILKSPEAMNPSHRLWTAGVESTGGHYKGALANCFRHAGHGTARRIEMRIMLKPHLSDPKTAACAELLLMALDENDSSDAELAAKIQKLIARKDIPYKLWWQVATQLELNNRKRAAIDVLEHVSKAGTIQSRVPFDVRLRKLYVAIGDTKTAKENVLSQYRAARAEATHNDKAVRHRSLETQARCAFELASYGDFMTSIRIYHEISQMHELVKEFDVPGSSQNASEKLHQTFQLAASKLTIDDMLAFLKDADKNEYAPWDMFPLASTRKATPKYTSLAAFAITGLSADEMGRAKLATIHEAFIQQSRTANENIRLASLLAMTSITLEDPRASERIDRLTGLIRESDLSQKQTVKEILELYSPALLAQQSKNSRVRKSAQPLVDEIIRVAMLDKSPHVAGLLLRTQIARDDFGAEDSLARKTLEQYLDLSVPEGRQISESNADDGMDIAVLASKIEAWKVATEALRRVFSAESSRVPNNLPAPIGRRLLNQSKSPLRNNTRMANRIEQMHTILAAHPISTQEHNDQSTYRALTDIVIGADRQSPVTPYLPSYLDDKRFRTKAFDNPVRVNLAALLAKSAIASGNVDDLKKRLTAVKSKATSRLFFVTMIEVELAAQQNLDAELSAALAEMNREFNAATRSNSSVAKENIHQDAIECVVHTAVRLHERKKLPKELIQLESDLLAFVALDEKTFAPDGIWTWFANQMLARPEVPNAIAIQAIDSMLGGVEIRHRTASPEVIQTKQNEQALRLLRAAIDGRRPKAIGRLMRKYLSSHQGLYIGSSTPVMMAMDLTKLSAELRYEVLKELMFSNGKGNIRPVVSTATHRLYAMPPEVLQPVVVGQEVINRIPIAHPDFPVFSTALLMAETAAELEKTDDLEKQIRSKIVTAGGERDAMLGIALLADKRVAGAGKVLDRVVESLKRPLVKMPPPIPIESAIFLARSLQFESLRDRAASAWPKIQSKVKLNPESLSSSHFDRVTWKLNENLSDATAETPYNHWISVQSNRWPIPANTACSPLYSSKDQTLWLGSGSDRNVLMFKYPLEGDFAIRHRYVEGTGEESGVYFGGTAYYTRDRYGATRVRALSDRNDVSWRRKLTKGKLNEDFELNIAGDNVQFRVNGAIATVDKRTPSMPFAGVFFHGHSNAQIADLQITGTPTIPRSVKMIHQELRGWSCTLIQGELVSARLPVGENEFFANVNANRNVEQRNARTLKSWYVDGNELRTGLRPSKLKSGQRHIVYGRPVLPQESVRYQFMYKEGTLETNPTIGRVAVLIRNGKLKLRWIGIKRSIESFRIDELNEVDMEEMLVEKAPLQPNDWNDVTITNEDGKFLITINGIPTARFTPGLDQRPGFLCEKDRDCQVRDVQLTGPWPEALPIDVTQPRKK